MTRLLSHSLLPVLGITMVLAATSCCQAQIYSADGRSGVYVQGNGQAMAGTFDGNGFQGIAVGPNGKVQRFDGTEANPFFKGNAARTTMGNGAFAGTMAGRTAIGPGGFDPFAFVFGNGAKMSNGVGVVAGPQTPQNLAIAKQALRQGRYQDAVRMIDQIRPAATDIEAIQVKGLALFAMQEYERAAAAAYTVLKADAAWDWNTLQQMSLSRESYVRQLRSLQTAAATNAPAAVHFLLAYHYLMLDHTDAARGELIKTRQLQPDNQLIDELLASLPPSVAGQ